MANIYTGSNVGKSGLEIKKTSGSPDVRGVTEISLDSNLSLTDNGNGSISIDSTGGGGGSAVPGGSNTEVQFNDSNTFGGTANLVFDKTNARLGVGISAPLGNLHLKSSEVDNNLLIETTTDPATAGAPDIILYQNAALQNNDTLGTMNFAGQNSSGAGSQVTYAEWYATAREVSAGNEDGSLILKVRTDGTENNRIGIMPTETVMNEDAQGGTAANIDFRVETNSSQHMIFAQGSTNRVGIKQSTPAVELDVGGTIRQTNTTDAIVYANASGDLGSVSIGAGLNLSAGTISLSNTGVTPATYGTATEVPQIAVDDKGRITSATSVSITGVPSLPAGANTQIQFNNSGALGANANFVFDTAATEMAIGGTNPKAKLTLYGDGTLGGGLNLADAGGDDWYIYQNTSNELVIRDDGNDRIFVDTSGNLGIGVSNPAQALDVDGSIQQSGVTDNIVYTNEVGKLKPLLYDQSIVLDVPAGPDNFGTIRANLLGNKQTASTSNGPLPRRDVFGTLVPFGWIAIPSSVTQLGANAPSTNAGNVYVPCWYSP